jgi:hypothetical protein
MIVDTVAALLFAFSFALLGVSLIGAPVGGLVGFLVGLIFIAVTS